MKFIDIIEKKTRGKRAFYMKVINIKENEMGLVKKKRQKNIYIVSLMTR